MVMFQNESWSYTNYPGCAWTAEGIIRFNTEYLAPTLKKQHPEIKLYLGTINTNRYDVIDRSFLIHVCRKRYKASVSNGKADRSYRNSVPNIRNINMYKQKVNADGALSIGKQPSIPSD